MTFAGHLGVDGPASLSRVQVHSGAGSCRRRNCSEEEVKACSSGRPSRCLCGCMPPGCTLPCALQDSGLAERLSDRNFQLAVRPCAVGSEGEYPHADVLGGHESYLEMCFLCFPAWADSRWPCVMLASTFWRTLLCLGWNGAITRGVPSWP